jgi:hypothetical protein
MHYEDPCHTNSVGACPDQEEKLSADKPCKLPVVVINDLDRDWKGQVRLRFERAGRIFAERAMLCEVPAWGRVRQVFETATPNQAGHYEIRATLLQPGDTPSSVRDVDVLPTP